MKKNNTNLDREPSVARKRFLDAARKEFAAKGYAGASIRAIASSLQMRESAFYAHFKSKQDAYDEIFREAGPMVIAVLASEIDVSRPPRTELSGLAERAMRSWTSPTARASTSILLREVFEKEGARRRQMLRGVSEALDVLQAKLESWQKAGCVSRDPDARTLAFQFVSPLITTRLLFYSTASTPSERRYGHTMIAKHVDMFVRLITGGCAFQ